MNICVIGGGNIGTLIAAELSCKDGISVRLLTSKPELWNREILIIDTKNKTEFVGKIDIITNEPSTALDNVDIILITVPSFAVRDIFCRIEPYVRENVIIGVIPGTGGTEFYFSKLLSSKGCTLFGFQRVHSITRIKDYGHSVYMTGRKTSIYAAAIPKHKTLEVCNLLSWLFDMPCYPLKNYLCVTLTPSNSLLHTTRLYSMFKDYIPGMYWHRNIAFYEEWDNVASDILLKCDDELQRLCSQLSELDLSAVKSLREHYESNTSDELTRKIRSIDAFKGIYSPMIKKELGYIPDFQSRYFTEDFPYGLCIIKGFCCICDVDTPYIDDVLRWYERIVNQEYFTKSGFDGQDLVNTAIPQQFGIQSKTDIYYFYS